MTLYIDATFSNTKFAGNIGAMFLILSLMLHLKARAPLHVYHQVRSSSLPQVPGDQTAVPQVTR